MWKFDETDYIKRVLSPAVDAFKNSARVPDYFERYDLPLEVSDTKDIETAITTVHGCWNKSKQNPRFTKLLSVLLAQKEQQVARSVLLDKEAREALRQQAEAERKKQREARFATLDKLIEVVASKGYVTPEQQKKLFTQFKAEGLTEQEIKSRVRVPVREVATQLPTDEGLPKTVREQIRNSLSVLRKRDLYEFLAVERGCTKERLTQRHRESELEWRPKPSDFNKTAAQTLHGIVKKYMVDGDPAKYEAALAYDAVEALRPEVQMAASGKRITKSVFEKLLAHAASDGLAQKTATEYILTLAENYGASVEWSVSEDTVRCANCSTLVSLKGKPENCTACGESLWANCPKCAARVASSDAACAKCGFKIGELPRVRYLTRRAQLELDGGRLEEAQETAREAERLWGRTGDIDKVLKKIEAGISRVGSLRRDIDEALAAHRLFDARHLLASLLSAAPNYKGRDGKDLAQLKSEIDEGLRKCEALLAKGREHERNKRLNDAVFAYLDALKIASDAVEAKKGLERCPPEPPGSVRAKAHEEHVLVEWSPSLAVGDVEYLVVGREGRAAVSPGDGELVSRGGSTSCLDKKARAASYIFYTIFTERGGVLSKPVSSAGVLVTREVRGLTIEASDGVVKGSWELDIIEGRVRVFRQEGRPPGKAGEGREITLSGPHNFTDRGVSNGRLYYYRVVVEYRDAAGHPVFTTGVVKSIKPEQPPPSIEEFQITLEQGVLHIAWTPPSHGAVSFYRTANKPAWQNGEQIPAAKLAGFGVPLRNDFNNLAVDFTPPEQPVFYVPVTVAGDVAVVGRARRYLATQDVSQLKAQDFGRYIQLQWRWPTDCRLALVAWRNDAYPQDAQDPRAEGRRISKGEYEAQGSFRLEHPDKPAYYFVVYVASKVEGEYMYSAGVSPGARALVRVGSPTIITYSIKRGNWLHRNRVTITLNADKAVGNLPDILVIARRGDLLPLRSSDGVVLATFTGLSLSTQASVSHEFDLDSVGRPCYLRAFFRDATSAQRFRLMDPSPQRLKVN